MSSQEIDRDSLPEGDELGTEVEIPEGEAVVDEPELEALVAAPKWDASYKESFSELGALEGGRKFQQTMLDMYNGEQANFTRTSQERAEYARQVEGWDGVFKPYQDFMNRNGLDAQGAARQGMGFMMSLAQDPHGFIKQLADRAGVELQKPEDAPYVPPEVMAVQKELQELKQGTERSNQRAMQQEQARVGQQIESFAFEQDANGNQKHPHFQAVEGLMTYLLNTGQAGDLPTAYEKACLNSSEVISAGQAEKAHQETARKASDAKKATEAARRPPGKAAGKDTSSSSQKDDILAAIREQTA